MKRKDKNQKYSYSAVHKNVSCVDVNLSLDKILFILVRNSSSVFTYKSGMAQNWTWFFIIYLQINYKIALHKANQT